MQRGLSIAASGMVAEMARQDALSADLANATTPGYKADRVSQGAFGQLLVTDLATGRQTGTLVAGARITGQVTDLRPAALRDTGELLDFAIVGEGYFGIQTPDGPRYTRGGSFRADATNRLVDQNGNAVMGRGGQPITVRADGSVAPDALGVFAVPNARKVGDSYFTGAATGQAGSEVRSGALEASGVDAARTVVAMMSSLRAIEAGQKALTTIDETLGRLNQVGNLRG